MNASKQEIIELVERGKVLYSIDNYDEAEKYLKKAMELDPYCEAAYENLGICYIMSDRYSDAKSTFNKYLMLNKKSGLAYFHLGNIALLENNAEEAKAMYSKAELLGYQQAVMYINLASYYEELGDYENALAQYNKLLRANPYAYDIMEKKTQMLIRTGRFDEGLTSAKKMVETDIDRFEGHHYVYVGLIMLQRYDEAKRYIVDVIDRFPDNQTARFDRVRLHDLTGNVDQALTLLEQDFADCNGLRQVALLKLGLLLQKERVDDALNLVEGSEVLQQDADALTLMYSLYFGRQDYQKAMEYCGRINALGEKSPQYYASWYFNALALSKMGEQYKEEAANAFEKASSDLRSVCLSHPERVDLNMYRVLCEYQLGHFDEAKRIGEFLVAVQPKEATFHLALAIVLEAMGNLAEAENHRNKAKELDPQSIAPLV